MNLQKFTRIALALLFFAGSTELGIGAVVTGSKPGAAARMVPDRSPWSSTTSNQSSLSRLATEANDAVVKGQEDLGISLCTRALSLHPDKKVASFLYHLRAEAYCDKNRSQAMNDAESAIRVDPSAPYGYVAPE